MPISYCSVFISRQDKEIVSLFYLGLSYQRCYSKAGFPLDGFFRLNTESFLRSAMQKEPYPPLEFKIFCAVCISNKTTRINRKNYEINFSSCIELEFLGKSFVKVGLDWKRPNRTVPRLRSVCMKKGE